MDDALGSDGAHEESAALRILLEGTAQETGEGFFRRWCGTSRGRSGRTAPG